MREIWVVEDALPSQERLCFMKLVRYVFRNGGAMFCVTEFFSIIWWPDTAHFLYNGNVYKSIFISNLTATNVNVNQQKKMQLVGNKYLFTSHGWISCFKEGLGTAPSPTTNVCDYAILQSRERKHF